LRRLKRRQGVCGEPQKRQGPRDAQAVKVNRK
jgi:hypothetical protein